MLVRTAPKGTVWESLLGETLKQRRWSVLLSSGRNPSRQRQGSEKALFTEGYGDQHTHCLPGGAFLHSERLQHRPGFGGGGLKWGMGGTCNVLDISIRVYKQLQGSGSCRVEGTRGKKPPTPQSHSKESKQGGQVRAFSTMAPPTLRAKTQKAERKGADKGGCNTPLLSEQGYFKPVSLELP